MRANFDMTSSVTLLAFMACLASIVVNACDKSNWTPMPPEKRVVHASIAIKALVTNLHPDLKHPDSGSVLAELWILDVYKGQDKLAAALGLPGTGADAVFHLKDQ